MTQGYALAVTAVLAIILFGLLGAFAAAFAPESAPKRDVQVRYDYGARGDGTVCYWHGGPVPCSWGVHNLRVIYRMGPRP